MNDLIKWDVYEISSEESELNGVKLRGRIRKFGLEKSINILAENTEDVEGGVRIGVFEGSDVKEIEDFLKTLVKDVKLELKLEKVVNPVLSKLKVNNESRYEI
jgi:acylphosphatase